MNKQEVRIGEVYLVKVTDKVVPVEILEEHTRNGWIGRNTVTGREIRIKSARRLRGIANEASAPTNATEAMPTFGPESATVEPESNPSQVTPRREEGPSGANVAAVSPEKRLSLLDAALVVLRDAGVPLGSREIVKMAAARGLWEPRTGKTPEATLYASMLREIAAKGAESRFIKAERGKFALNG